VAKLNLPQYANFAHYESAAIHGGPRVMHPDFCLVSDRPRLLKVDDQNRPHCDDGPFCRWSDGTALYAVHGVRVPAWVIETPEKITVDLIESQPNIEVRRVMIDKYGQARYLLDAGAKEVHRDDFGTLYRKDVPGDEPLLMVKVVNSTPESDGTFKDYFLRVAPDCAPLLSGNRRGAAQELTARNAVASTFGLRGEEYDPCLQT
jgi:hypothetical protein